MKQTCALFVSKKRLCEQGIETIEVGAEADRSVPA